jgi:hypothetical protein
MCVNIGDSIVYILKVYVRKVAQVAMLREAIYQAAALVCMFEYCRSNVATTKMLHCAGCTAGIANTNIYTTMLKI